MSCTKAAGPIEMPFGMLTRVGPRNCVRWGAHWHHLANTIEPSMCGGDAAFLSNYFNHLLLLGRIAALARRSLLLKINKSSAVAEIGDRDYYRHAPTTGGCCAHLAGGWVPV